MHPKDAEEDAPRKRRPRRRRSSTSEASEASSAEERAARFKEPEAAAFLEPPPLEVTGEREKPAKKAAKKRAVRAKTARKKRARRVAKPAVEGAGEAAASEVVVPEPAGDDAGGVRPARKRRARRSRKRAADKSVEAAGSGSAGSGSARAEPPAAGASEARDAPADAAASADEQGSAEKPARKRRPRRSRRRSAEAPREAEAIASSDEDAPAGASADAADAPEGKRRARRSRKRGRRRRSAPEGSGVGSEPDFDAPPAPGDEPSGATVTEEAGADAPAPSPAAAATEGDAKSGRRKRGGREKRKRGRKEGEGRERTRRGGRKSEGRKSDGRRPEGRKSEGRRSEGRGDRRHRDPRAIDIVPRAPTPEEAAREKVLLVNASDREEARIALLVDGVLAEVYIETASSERSSAGNIYRGRVQNVERGIGAAFVDLGRGVTGFLHASDLPLQEGEDASADVTERLHAGDEVIVQITRDSIGRKGPALTGRISFAGRYLVLMPFTARSGISRRIPQGRERDRVRKLLRKLEVPEGMGVIVRTSSETTDLAALDADLAHLLKEWEFIERKAAEPGQPGMLRGESDLAERSVRDIMPSDVARIVVDRDDIAGRIHRLLRVWYPSAAAAADEAAHEAVRSVSATMDTPRGEIVAGAHAGSASPAEPEAEPEVEVAPGQADVEGEAAGDAAEVATEEAAGDVDGHEIDGPEVDGHEVDGHEDDGHEDDDHEDEDDDVVDVDVDADVDVDVDEDDIDDVDDVDELGEAEEVDEEDDVEELDDVEEDDEDDEDDAASQEPEETPAERLERLTQMARAMPEVELHTDPLPLFHKYGAETQLEDAFRRSTRLPSGGSIVIDPTEALVAVDVNSGRLTDETDPESTALVTNLEAVQETARQLRLRDLGGLVVIDFIDMRDRKSRKKVESALREALSGDRARIRMGRMGPFGLVVLSRQRIRQALSRVTHDPCTDCGGTGYRRQISGLGLRVLREMEARVARSRGRGGLGVRAPQEVVTWIKKNRSGVIKQLKKACSGPITLEADARLAVDGWAMKGLPPEGPGETEDS